MANTLSKTVVEFKLIINLNDLCFSQAYFPCFSKERSYSGLPAPIRFWEDPVLGRLLSVQKVRVRRWSGECQTTFPHQTKKFGKHERRTACSFWMQVRTCYGLKFESWMVQEWPTNYSW